MIEVAVVEWFRDTFGLLVMNKGGDPLLILNLVARLFEIACMIIIPTSALWSALNWLRRRDRNLATVRVGRRFAAEGITLGQDRA